jgi:hypothetical protein
MDIVSATLCPARSTCDEFESHQPVQSARKVRQILAWPER